MKIKVYHLIDVDFAEVLLTSTNRADVEEELLDIFMESFHRDMMEAADAHWISCMAPSHNDRIFVRDTWNQNSRWIDECFRIQEAEIEL